MKRKDVHGNLSESYTYGLSLVATIIFMTRSVEVAGLATVLMALFIDPHLSVLTDDAVLGKVSAGSFRKYIVYMVIARIGGTLLAQLLFLPCAHLIAMLAESV
nr:DUF2837 family protein [Chitinophaga niastensis]